MAGEGPLPADSLSDGRPGDGQLFSDNEWTEIACALKLPPQQQGILSLLLQGMGDKQIACALDIASPNVRTYIGRMCAHLGVNDRAGLILRIFREFQIRCIGCPCHRIK